MTNYMPLVYQARRTIANRAAGNPFANDAQVAQIAAEVTAAYLKCGNVRTSERLKVELDRLDSISI